MVRTYYNSGNQKVTNSNITIQKFRNKPLLDLGWRRTKWWYCHARWRHHSRHHAGRPHHRHHPHHSYSVPSHIYHKKFDYSTHNFDCNYFTQSGGVHIIQVNKQAGSFTEVTNEARVWRSAYSTECWLSCSCCLTLLTCTDQFPTAKMVHLTS